MRSRFSRSLVVVVAAALLGPSTRTAQASDERHRSRVGSEGPISAAIAANSAAAAAFAAQPKADPVSNGVGIGVAIGGATGLGLMHWAYTQCQDTCDAPEPAPMYLMAGGFGAAVGGVVGWLVDAARKNTYRRVAIGGAIAPKHSHLQVRVQW